MATLSSRGDSFKTFLAEKKAEYRSKFPFLTESQVVAKLKRVWNNQQARDTRATAVKSSAVDTKSEWLYSTGDGGDKHTRSGNSAGRSILMSSKGLPGETLRRKVKPPPLSRSLSCFATSHSITTTTTHLPPSPTDKENTDLPTDSSTTHSNYSNSSSPLLAMGGSAYSFSSSSPALDCYAFTEDEQQHITHVHKRSCYTEDGHSSSLVKHKYQRPTWSVSFSKNSNQNVTELKSSKGSSSYGTSLKGSTQLVLPNDSASLQTAAASNKNSSKQVNKKPRSATSAADAAARGVRKTRSSLRNAVAAATNYQTTTMNSGSRVISAGYAGTVDIRDKQHSLSTKVIINRDNMKGVRLSLSDHSAFDSDPSLDQEMGSNRLLCTGEQEQEQRQALQPAAGAIVDVDLDGECCTMPCSVYNCESQIMGLALRSSSQTRGDVESGGPLPGLSEHSHGHSSNAAVSTESNTADSALPIISGALGNPKTDSIPTQTSASASGSCPLQSGEPATCVHNDTHECIELMSSHDDAGADLGGTESTLGGGKQRGRGRGRRGGRRRGRGRGKKKDPSESWIHTNSQPQTCDRVEDPLEFSQNEQISCSLPEITPGLVESQPDTVLEEPASDMIWEESALPNMVSKESFPEGREEERNLRRRGLGTRASFRGRGRRIIRGGGRGQRGRGTMKTTSISGRVTRSRTAALLKSKMEEAKDKEKMDFSSESEKADLPSFSPPPAKKQKPRHEESPRASRESKSECSENNGVTVMDISASSPANTVCGVNDGVALSDAGAANIVCGEPRDSSTASALFSTASANNGSKHTPSLAIRPCEELGLLSFETPSLHATTAAEAGCTGVASSSGKPCKSSSPSPPFAQCSSTTPTTSSQPQAQQPSMQLTPIQVDPLCDMFLPLTPERKKNDIYKDIGSFYSEAPTERRTVLPAPAGSEEDKGYCLFADDADIFL